ncbi:putative membrane protein [Chlamydia psittaci 02DC21]|nr:putative membrane protein [Chlamydia psittaci 02DC21]
MEVLNEFCILLLKYWLILFFKFLALPTYNTLLFLSFQR